MKQFEKIIDKLKERRIELEMRLNKIEQNLRMPHDRDSEEQALEREEDDVLKAFDENTREELQQIYNALDRVKRNEYGTCVTCENSIPVERLDILPYTDRCVECADEK